MCLQRVEGCKLHFVAKLGDEFNLQFLAIEIAGKFKQVNFEAALMFASLNGWARADVDGGVVTGAVHKSPRGINPIRWQNESGHIQIGRGKAELVAELIARNDRAADGVGAA